MTETSKARFETRRNYSLRLQGDGQEWKEALWRTHEMVNAGTKCVADWLLTLRGGLDASYVSSIEDPLEAKWARKLLVLSWLSVESALGAPQQYLLAGQEASEPTEDVASRERVMINALMDILKLKGVSTEDSGIWIEDCRSSLCASLREDATWVNRAQAFEDLAKRVGTISQDDVWDLLGRVFVFSASISGTRGDLSGSGSPHPADITVAQQAGLAVGRVRISNSLPWRTKQCIPPVLGSNREWTGAQVLEKLLQVVNKAGDSEYPPDLSGFNAATTAPGHRSRTKNLLAKMHESDGLTQEDLDALSAAAEKNAASCRSKVGAKGPRKYSDGIMKDLAELCGFSYLDPNTGKARHHELAVIFDQAARRVSLAHSKCKLAEQLREKFDEGEARFYAIPEEARNFLDGLCKRRGRETGAIGPYLIRPRAVQGWERVVALWGDKKNRVHSRDAIRGRASCTGGTGSQFQVRGRGTL